MNRINTVYTKSVDKRLNGIDLLANRIEKNPRPARGDSKRNPWEAGTGTHIEESPFRRSLKRFKEQERIENVQNQGIVYIEDAREIHLLVRLDDKREVIETTTDLLIAQVNLELIAI